MSARYPLNMDPGAFGERNRAKIEAALRQPGRLEAIVGDLETRRDAVQAERAEKRTKYGNEKQVLDGLTFDSKKEARRYQHLKALQAIGTIKDLDLQVRFRIEVNGAHICDYIVDFVYVRCATNERVVEDVKGHRTSEYKLKKKLVAAVHGIEIQEV